MDEFLKNPEKFYQKLMSVKQDGDAPYFQADPSETHLVKLRPKKDVPIPKFLPDPLVPGGWLAHPQTIKAVRADIFMGGDEFIDLEILYQCQSCHEKLDLQFWKWCPYCETPFPKEVFKDFFR